MTLRKRTVARRLGAGVAIVAALAMAAPPQAGYALSPQAKAKLSAAARAQSYSVTLITGDRVLVRPHAGTYAVEIVKGAGRARMPFSVHRTKTGLAVVPADAIALIASKKLEERLFDVVLLHKLGYDDAHSREIPLLTAVSPGAKLAATALPGIRTVRTLPSFGVASVKAAKKDAGAFWRSVTGTGSAGSLAAAASVAKIRLVGKLQPTLDESAKQVGAPVAWAAGHTGAGATVAVVDTGIDATHPDLAGVVTDAKDFTQSPVGVKDEVGHGTHVAGTIAGRGTASGGKYTGIAKGAQLKSAKVCQLDGCTEDAILFGMDWAANSGAKVINMSLGGPPSETGDLLEEAVDYYTAKNGVLFVVAAGNSGAPETIGSPGIADSALTVGSVDKGTDALSDFSSQGPRVSPSRRLDYAIKPDITAPGNGIVAPRAEGTLEDYKVDEHYARLSGTSMATPHVSGAAAILAAEHATWTPAQLKASLTSTSKAIAGQTVYQQGAGRLDIGRASTQDVTATGILNLGYFPWPNAKAAAAKQTVTYTNDGTKPVTLGVTLSVNDDKGKPAPAKMFTASTKSVTVQAGKTATVTVTINPKLGKAGLYSGALSAISKDGVIAVHSAVGAYKEPESYNLSLTQLSRAGAKGPTDITIINRATGEAFFDYGTGTTIKRVPAGDYTVLTGSYVVPADPTTEPDSVLEARNVKLNKATDLLFDARKGKPVAVTLDRADAAIYGDIALNVSQSTADAALGNFIMGGPGHIFAVPTTGTIANLEYGVTATFARKGLSPGTAPAQAPAAWTYNVAIVGKGKLPAGSPLAVKKADMAVVHQKINSQSPDEVRELVNIGEALPNGVGLGMSLPLGDLAGRDDYFTTVKDTTFEPWFVSGSATPQGSDMSYITFADPKNYAPRSTETVSWDLGVFGPALPPSVDQFAAGRLGDEIVIAPPMFSDRDHLGGPGSFDTGYTRLLKDGATIAETDYPGFVDATGVPAQSGRYVAQTSLKRAAAWADLSRQIDVTWSFTSAHVDGDTPATLPLLAVRYLPALDARNGAPAGKAFTFPVKVQQTAGAPAATVTSLTVEVSYDGGTTWKSVALTGTGADRTASVTHPAKGTVSLRAKAADSAGNTVEQTIINAYFLH